MKYKLLKDLPFAKAGEVFEMENYKSKDGLSDYDYLKIAKQVKDGENKTMFTIDCNYFLDNFDEWFEKLADNTRRTPRIGEPYFYIDEYGSVEREIWDNDGVDNELLSMGVVYLTPKEAVEARDRRLAEVRLRQTSDFEPDWEDGLQKKYVVIFNHVMKRLEIHELTFEDLNLPVYFESEEDASKSIYRHKADWLKYLGIKEEN